MFFDRFDVGRRAVLLHVRLDDTETFDAQEFGELARSAGIDVVGEMLASRRQAHPRWLVGSGKVEEVRDHVIAVEANLVLVNSEMTPGQQRNLEVAVECRVMTRTELILNIFADRARTHEGQLQVELAQLKHAQTRLIRGWTHLDRQKGGIGLRGVGETQLELDQRLLGERIKTLQKKLGRVEQRRGQGRRRRHRSGTPTIALVGYTNAGKSTLFNALTAADVVVQDQLFATLDPTMRKLKVPGVGDVVMADTVGFISRLPHTLVDAFKATLEELKGSDLLIHVVDGAVWDSDRRIADVLEVLKEIGAASVPMVTVLNKSDLVTKSDLPSKDTVRVSAKTGAGLENLIDALGRALGVKECPIEVLLPASQGKTRAWLYEAGAVVDEQTAADGRVVLTVRADDRLLHRLRGTPRVLLRNCGPVPRISSLPN